MRAIVTAIAVAGGVVVDRVIEILGEAANVESLARWCFVRGTHHATNWIPACGEYDARCWRGAFRKSKNKKARRKTSSGLFVGSRSLLELRLFVEHVLASDWIKFLDREFFAHRFFVFGRRVEVAGAS
jgi:hypothetical protein